MHTGMTGAVISTPRHTSTRRIDNPLSTSPLTITAGTDINISASIDGDSITAQSGAVTMTASGEIGINQDIVTKNAAISRTSTGGLIASSRQRRDWCRHRRDSLMSGSS